MKDSIRQFDELVRSSNFVFLVFIRGHWCPFCMSYLRKLQDLSDSITSNGGRVVVVTAEAESELHKTRSSSGYEGLVIVDPENLLAAELKRRGLLNVALSEKKGYPHGLAQPAVLVLQSDRVLFKWAIVPSTMNFGGAKDRPVLEQVWHNAESQLRGQPEVHEKLKFTTASGLLAEKLFPCFYA